MTEKKRINPELIKIREFKLIKGQVDSPFEFQIQNIASFDYSVNLNNGFNFPEKLIKSDITFNVSTISKEKVTEANGFYHFVFIYHFEDLTEHAAPNENGTVDWNPYLANAIASITYSTSRGILLSRFQGTVMRDFMLPVVDPNSLFENKELPKSL